MLTHHNEKPSGSPTGFDFGPVDPSWYECLKAALQTVDTPYLETLYQTNHWLPGKKNIFNAFSLPLEKVNYVLFGESPYPRVQSANGYAFWDAAVTNLWSDTGLSKTVNRATSLRNLIKMLLIAAGRLKPEATQQADIAALDKSDLIQTNEALFTNFLKHGFLLLNATPVLQPDQVRKDARQWKPFIAAVMAYLAQHNPRVQCILLGNIANEIDPLLTAPGIKKWYAEHPYNISFITNPVVWDFFRPLHLLQP